MKLDEEDLKHLQAFGDLETLSITQTNLTDKCVRSLLALTSLKELNLQETEITDASLEFLGQMKPLEGVKTLYVAGVNEMAGVPVEVVTHDFTVSYVPSGSFLAHLPLRPPASSQGLLVLADPLLTKADAELKPQPETALAPAEPGGGLDDLPGQRQPTVASWRQAVRPPAFWSAFILVGDPN